MNSRYLIIILALVSIGLTACGDKDKRESIGDRGRRDSQRTGGSDHRDLDLNDTYDWPGAIVASQQNLFQQATEGFVSSFMSPQDLGTVSGRDQDTVDPRERTGVRFFGFVEWEDGYFNPNNSDNGNYIVEDSARFEILIKDSIAVEEDSGTITAENLRLVDFDVYGREVSLTFEDGDGRVMLRGEYNSDYYYGEISFENYSHYDGDEPEYWDPWGTFYVPVCDFFRCDNY